MKGERENIIRIFHMHEATGFGDLQDTATVVRALAEIRYVFMYNARKVLAMRDVAVRMEMAEWLVSELNQPLTVKPGPVPPRVFNIDNDPANTVQLFRIPSAGTSAQLIETARSIRASTSIRRLFPHAYRRVIAMRATPDQIAEAARLIGALESE